jgi:hypothetical protein
MLIFDFKGLYIGNKHEDHSGKAQFANASNQDVATCLGLLNTVLPNDELHSKPMRNKMVVVYLTLCQHLPKERRKATRNLA